MKTIAIGCDVSKDSIDIFIKSEPPQRLKIDNNETGYSQFQQQLKNGNRYHICMEATGSYHEALADYCFTNNHQISVINPLKIKHYIKARFSRTKTDKQDAQLIADYCEDHKPKPDYQKPTEQQYAVKRHIAHLNRLTTQLTALKNQLSSAQDKDISEQLTEQLELIKNQIKRTKHFLAQNNQTPSCTNIATIPGIGQTTAVILSHYLTHYRFTDANQFTAFAGLAPQIIQSGSSVRQKDRLSRLGNRTLKAALYMPAVVAYRIGLFKGLVSRMKQKGKSGKQIIVAIMRKLACLAFTLWQKQEPYRCNAKTA